MTRIVVVGGGPAGLTAALAAAGAGAEVLLCEKQDECGRKLLATGGGRCNLTNTLPAEEFAARFGRQGRFLGPALAAFGPETLREFLRTLGVRTHAADGFHVFPEAESARAVRDALVGECLRRGVTLRTRTEPAALRIRADRAAGVLLADGEEIAADRVIVATGSPAWPSLGAEAGGYALARAAGHALVEPVPALAPLITAEDWPARAAGTVLHGARLRIDLPRQTAESRGELLFTHEGLSGPAALDLSGAVSRLLLRMPLVPILVEPFPDETASGWEARINAWRTASGRKCVRTLLDGTLPASLAGELARLAGAQTATAASLPKEARQNLARILSGIPLSVRSTGGFKRAMVASGGISLKGIEPRTLGSRLLPGLFLCGEALDLDGPCGGFNLQWAFSSGFLAGISSASTNQTMI